MFKKLIIAGAILAATSSLAFAGAAPYVGVGVGADTSKTTFKEFDGATGNLSSKDDLGLVGVMGNAFVGYGGTIAPNFYLGGEVFADASSANGKIEETGADRYELKRQYGYGISLIPGVFITDHTMLYARAGVLRSHFKVTHKNDSTGVSENPTQNDTGYQFGVGLQAWFTQNLAVRAEYNYTTYNNFSKTGLVQTTSVPADTYKFEPIFNQATLGLVYCFG